MASNSHPDHDTICTFRRSNFEAVGQGFLQVLLMAKELKLVRVGTVSVDGTKVDANANKRNSIRYDRAGELGEQLRGEIEELLAQAERADTEEAPDPQRLPAELRRREKLGAKLDQACAELERRAKARAASERFRQFLLRGLEKVEGEWALVTLAYNCRRLNNLRLA